MGVIIGDVVVVVPGIMGSTLARRWGDRLIPIWAPSPGGLVNALKTFGGSIRSLKLEEDVDDGDPDDGIVPTGLMPGIHAIPGLWSGSRGYSRLVSWLEETFHLISGDPAADPDDEDRPCPNLVCFAYDWRLSNKRNAQLLKDTVEPVLIRWRAQDESFQQARFVFVCHSMGGLLARWYAEQLGGAELTRKIITIATPHRGSVTALEGLVNGMRKGVGPFGVTLTEIVRTFPSMYELLPSYECVESDNGLRAPHEITLPELDLPVAAGRRAPCRPALADRAGVA